MTKVERNSVHWWRKSAKLSRCLASHVRNPEDLKGVNDMYITAEQAERVLKTSILKARELGISVCIAILDREAT